MEEEELLNGIDANVLIEIIGPSRDAVEDLSHLEALKYRYPAAPGGKFGYDEVEIESPLTRTVCEDGSHHILCADRVGMTLPPGFVLIESYPKFGHAPFAGHPIASDLVTD
jgi:hypothetical protein